MLCLADISWLEVSFSIAWLMEVCTRQRVCRRQALLKFQLYKCYISSPVELMKEFLMPSTESNSAESINITFMSLWLFWFNLIDTEVANRHVLWGTWWTGWLRFQLQHTGSSAQGKRAMHFSLKLIFFVYF